MISAATIDNVLERMSDQSPAQAEALVKRMSEEQPDILAYMLAMSEYEDFSREERELFLYVGIVLWQILQRRPGGCKRVTDEHLDQMQKANEDVLEKMASDSEGDFVGATLSMVESYPEPEVLRYLTEVLNDDAEGPPGGVKIHPKNLGFAFLHLKVVLDALIAV